MPDPSNGLDVTEDASRGPTDSSASASAFGRYQVDSVLGTGGCGTVYRAHDPALDREVAIKCLHPAATSDVQAERIRSEAKALARLSHPNVVPIYDVGQRDGSTYIVMRRLVGPTLRQWMSKPRSQTQTISVLCAAGEGLLAAHELGLVHRDFKPDNVLLDVDGHPRVVDFGLVRTVEAASTESPGAAEMDEGVPLDRLTSTGALTGTPAYMAPEQFSGKEVDARSDQFAFCVVFFEALEGRRPFDGNGLADLVVNVEELDRAQLGRDSEWASSLMPILRRGLASDPDDRFDDMRALLKALARAGRRPARWWLPVLGVGTLAVALAALAAGYSDEPGTPEGSTVAPAAPRFSAEFAPLEAARSDLAAGRFSAAAESAEAAREASTDPRVQAAALLLESQALQRMLQIPRARQRADRALELTEGLDAPELRLEALLAVFGFMRTRYRDERMRIQEAESLLNRLEVPDAWRARTAMASAHAAGQESEFEQAALDVERGLEFASEGRPSATRSLLLASAAVVEYRGSEEAAAVRMLDKALADLSIFDEERPDVALRLRLDAANLLATQGRHERAQRLVTDATAVIAKNPNVPVLVDAEVRFTAAVVAYQAGRYDESEAALGGVAKDIEDDDAAWAALGPRTQLLEFQLVSLTGTQEEAFEKARVLLDSCVSVYGSRHQQTIAMQITLANFEVMNGVFDSSRVRLVEARRYVKPGSLRAADVECALARLAKAESRLEDVREHANACVEIYEFLQGRTGYRAQARALLAESLSKLGREEEAETEFKRAHAELIEAGDAWWVERRQLIVTAKRAGVELPPFENEGNHAPVARIEAIEAAAAE